MNRNASLTSAQHQCHTIRANHRRFYAHRANNDGKNTPQQELLYLQEDKRSPQFLPVSRSNFSFEKVEAVPIKILDGTESPMPQLGFQTSHQTSVNTEMKGSDSFLAKKSSSIYQIPQSINQNQVKVERRPLNVQQFNNGNSSPFKVSQTEMSIRKQANKTKNGFDLKQAKQKFQGKSNLIDQLQSQIRSTNNYAKCTGEDFIIQGNKSSKQSQSNQYMASTFSSIDRNIIPIKSLGKSMYEHGNDKSSTHSAAFKLKKSQILEATMQSIGIDQTQDRFMKTDPSKSDYQSTTVISDKNQSSINLLRKHQTRNSTLLNDKNRKALAPVVFQANRLQQPAIKDMCVVQIQPGNSKVISESVKHNQSLTENLFKDRNIQVRYPSNQERRAPVSSYDNYFPMISGQIYVQNTKIQQKRRKFRANSLGGSSQALGQKQPTIDYTVKVPINKPDQRYQTFVKQQKNDDSSLRIKSDLSRAYQTTQITPSRSKMNKTQLSSIRPSPSKVNQSVQLSPQASQISLETNDKRMVGNAGFFSKKEKSMKSISVQMSNKELPYLHQIPKMKKDQQDQSIDMKKINVMLQPSKAPQNRVQHSPKQMKKLKLNSDIKVQNQPITSFEQTLAEHSVEDLVQYGQVVLDQYADQFKRQKLHAMGNSNMHPQEDRHQQNDKIAKLKVIKTEKKVKQFKSPAKFIYIQGNLTIDIDNKVLR